MFRVISRGHGYGTCHDCIELTGYTNYHVYEVTDISKVKGHFKWIRQYYCDHYESHN